LCTVSGAGFYRERATFDAVDIVDAIDHGATLLARWITPRAVFRIEARWQNGRPFAVLTCYATTPDRLPLASVTRLRAVTAFDPAARAAYVHAGTVER
jgi:hypothetical protein